MPINNLRPILLNFLAFYVPLVYYLTIFNRPFRDQTPSEEDSSYIMRGEIYMVRPKNIMCPALSPFVIRIASTIYVLLIFVADNYLRYARHELQWYWFWHVLLWGPKKEVAILSGLDRVVVRKKRT
jgi:hypothetical protein